MYEKVIELRALSPLIETQVYTVQGDTGRKLKCRITDIDIPSGATAIFWAQKPSGKGIQNTAVIDGQFINVDLTNEILAEKGRIASQIQVSVSEDRIKTYRFTIVNEESYAGDWPESENQSTWLEGALKEMQDALDDYVAQKTTELDAAKNNAQQAAEYANNQGQKALNQAQAAELATNSANSIAQDLINRRESGEFNGPPGPPGPAGEDGKDGKNGMITTMSGQYAMQIKEDGHLYVVYPDNDTPPDLEIQNGHLILTIEGG